MESIQRVKRNLGDFNLFRTYTSKDDDEHEKKNQLVSTRMVVLFFFISLLILIIYICQSSVTHNHTVEHPSLPTYLKLERKHRDALACPCTNIAIRRQHFLTITPLFHHVCSSDFVSDSWLNYLRSASTRYVSNDFRFTGSVLFTMLASFCRLANETINDSLPSFYSTRFITSKVINRKQFTDEIESMINFYVTTTSDGFSQSFELIRDVTFSDGLIAGLGTNFQYTLTDYIPQLAAYFNYPSHRSYGECSCSISPSCISPATISDAFVVPGLYIGCYLLEAMRQSNLICLYNQTCLEQLSTHLQSPMNFTVTAMMKPNASRFNESTIIGEMLSVMMVDTWIRRISYSSYFNRCQPMHCRYSTMGRNEWIYLVTLIIGIFGGLYKCLLISVPIVVRFILKGWNFAMFHSNLFNSILSLNIFPSYPPSEDLYDLNTERISTLVYLSLLFISTLVLVLYNANRTITETTVVPNPSLGMYRNLYERFSSNSLSCPCSTIKSSYGQLISLKPIYHQMCHSDFMDNLWLTPRLNRSIFFFLLDLRRSASLIFHNIASYCSLSDRTISAQLLRFNSMSLITPTLLSENLFHNQTDELIRHFIQTFAEEFLQQFEFLRTNIYGNQIINGLWTNFMIFFQTTVSTSQLKPVSSPSTLYGNCLCDLSPRCSTRASIYNFTGLTYLHQFSFPGLQIGCYTSEALRQSTFECFFNQTCVDVMKTYLNIDSTINIRALDSSKSIRFNRTTTIDEMMKNLMVERWISNDSYGNYYNSCQPSFCSFRTLRKPPFVAVIMALLGLLGGLIDIFSLIVPTLIRWFRRARKSTNSIDIRKYKEHIIKFIRDLNLFRTKTPLDDQIDQTKIQILSTRLFLVIFLLSLIFLLTYTSQIEVHRTLMIDSPSFSTYLSFYDRYQDKIICLCSNFVTEHRRFVTIFVELHQICSSDFVDPRWPKALRQSHKSEFGPVYNRDFRFRSPYYFQSLASFCRLANQSLTGALETFYSDSLITLQLLPQSTFSKRINATIDLFRTSTIDTFVRSFRILRDTNFGNNLVSTTLSSFTFSLMNRTGQWQVELRYKTYNSSQCSCRDTSMCVEQSFIYTYQPYTPIFPVPGILVGCYVFESLLQSDLHYFYNQTALDWFTRAINVTQKASFRALDPLHTGDSFSQDEQIERILERMMINQWTQIVSYENYFKRCQPTECRYTYRQRFDILFIVTSVTALIGGLTSVLQMLLPFFVRLTRLYRCFSHEK